MITAEDAVALSHKPLNDLLESIDVEIRRSAELGSRCTKYYYKASRSLGCPPGSVVQGVLGALESLGYCVVVDNTKAKYGEFRFEIKW